MKTLFVTAALLTVSLARADGLVNLIDAVGGDTSSVNRTTPHVELRDLAGRDREYSVPYVPERQPKNVAADFKANWQTYQDSLHWAMIVGLNNDVTSLGTPHDVHFLNCELQFPADLTIAAGQTLTGSTWIKANPDAVNLDPSNPAPEAAGKGVPPGGVNGWRDDDLTLEPYAVPRVSRDRYCGYSSVSFLPDELEAFTPGVQECTPLGCIQTPNYPLPLSVNWGVLAGRLQAACNGATQGEYPKYQKGSALSVDRNLPLAIQWNGVASITGARSGTTMAPFSATTNAQSVAKVAQVDPRFPAYLTGALPFAVGLNVGTREKVGVQELEALKRYVSAGNLQEQEVQGVASFFQAWQQLDTVTDIRPIQYWAKAFSCDLLACTPVPVPLPMPPTVLALGACNVPAFGPGPGTTTMTQFRFRRATVSVPEGHTVPNLVGSPVLRTDRE